MIYVLIIMLAGSGSAVGSAEFSTKQACEDAGKMVVDARRAYSSTASAVTVCAPKG